MVTVHPVVTQEVSSLLYRVDSKFNNSPGADSGPAALGRLGCHIMGQLCHVLIGVIGWEVNNLFMI